MHVLFLIGRVLLGSYYLLSGINHFTGTEMAAGYAASKGVPFPTAAVIVSGALLIVAGLSFLLGWVPRLGVAALALFFVPVTLTMHQFWNVADPMARMAEMSNFAKNIALLSSALMFLAIPVPWPLSVGGRMRLRRQAPAPA